MFRKSSPSKTSIPVFHPRRFLAPQSRAFARRNRGHRPPPRPDRIQPRRRPRIRRARARAGDGAGARDKGPDRPPGAGEHSPGSPDDALPHGDGELHRPRPARRNGVRAEASSPHHDPERMGGRARRACGSARDGSALGPPAVRAVRGLAGAERELHGHGRHPDGGLELHRHSSRRGRRGRAHPGVRGAQQQLPGPEQERRFGGRHGGHRDVLGARDRRGAAQRADRPAHPVRPLQPPGSR